MSWLLLLDRESLVIEYRSFHNSDPPQLVALWHQAELGRGAAAGFTTDAFETLIFAQPYFDRDGLIVACDGSKIIGYAHAGFGANSDESALAYKSGVVCALIVHPQYRRRGVGRELMARAERYMNDRGVQTILAGPAEPNDPFYVGLYGGSQPCGFLDSDPDAAPFLAALGYERTTQWRVYQRDMNAQRDPMSFRLATHRRRTQLAIADRPNRETWWWLTRFGRVESLLFVLLPKEGGSPIGAVSVVGLDLYLQKWGERAVGLLDLEVNDEQRSEGYGQAILVEVCRRLKNELVTRIEAHALETDAASIGVLESSGFEQVDTGAVYRRT